VDAMSVCAITLEFTDAFSLPVSAYFSFVIVPEVFDVSQHLLPRLKLHFLFGPILIILHRRSLWLIIGLGRDSHQIVIVGCNLSEFA
jgi:hypothetical protein